MKIKEILDFMNRAGFGAEFIGDEEKEILGFSSINQYKRDHITWIKKSEYLKACNQDEIALAVIKKGVESTIKNRIITENPKELFSAVVKEFWGKGKKEYGVGDGSFLSDKVILHPETRIGCHCVLDGDIIIGRGTVIEDNVTIMNRVSIGEDCIIHAGTVIGKDSFSFYWDKDRTPVKVEQYGSVLIGDRVEIGSNTVINRGAIDDTRVGDDTKISSLTDVGHNCIIGQRVMVGVGCLLLGSSRVGDESYLSPRCILKNQTKLGNNCFVGMNVVVTSDMDSDTAWLTGGTTAVPMKDYRRFL